MPVGGKRPKDHSSLPAQKSLRSDMNGLAPKLRMLTASILPDSTIRKVAQCYGEDLLPADAGARCRISYATANRLYGLIRQRLYDVGVLRPIESYLDDMNGEQEIGYATDEVAFWKFLASRLGARRGIKRCNRPLYEAEAAFHFDLHPTPGQMFHLVMLAIKAGGPLNKPAGRARPALVHRELFRLRI